MKLVSMIDFVLDHETLIDWNTTEFASWEYSNDVNNYATFLNQPLNIGMFVPAIEVEGKWEVLEMPKEYELFTAYKGALVNNVSFDISRQYQQAKDKVLFEGVKCIDVGNGFIITLKGDIMFTASHVNIIEDLISFEPTLTAKGQQLSGLNK